MVVTVEDLQKVKLKRTPFNLFVSITHKYADIKTFQLQTFNSVLLRVKWEQIYEAYQSNRRVSSLAEA